MQEMLPPSFDIFITISVPAHFSNREFKALKRLEELNEESFTGPEELRQKLKQKAIKSVKNVLFFNIYEKQHIKNANDALLGRSNKEKYILIADSPQHLKKEWLDIAKGVGIKNVKIETHSEREPGIELADVVVGCVHSMINKDSLAQKIYRHWLKVMMLDMTSRNYPNPNFIFFPGFDERDQATQYF